MTTAAHDIRRDIEDFLYREAKLLDELRFEEWLDLLTDDVRYLMPITETRDVGQERGYQEGQWTYIEDDKYFLAKRLERLGTNLAHAEQPRSRTRRFISNVIVTVQDDGSVIAESNLLVFQSRRQTSEQFFVGSRRDRLVPIDGSWKVAERVIRLDHRVLPRAISFFL